MFNKIGDLIHISDADHSKLSFVRLPRIKESAAGLSNAACAVVAFLFGHGLTAKLLRLLFVVLEDCEHLTVCSTADRLHAGAAWHV